MSPSDQIAVSECLTHQGELQRPTTNSVWHKPEKVELRTGPDVYALISNKTAKDVVWPKFGSELVFEPPTEDTLGKKVKPSPRLFEDFLELATATDQRILKFANRYGMLEIFGRDAGESREFEHCEIWRYFSLALLSLLKIASQLTRGKSDSKEDWDQVGNIPPSMKDYAKQDSRQFFLHYKLKAEREWCDRAHFIARGRNRDKAMLVGLINAFLELGKVRPWLMWPKDATRPRVVYSSPSLSSYLALQLCLQVGKLEAFVVCCHCNKEFTPPNRAPKSGQRSFCPECRDLGIPKRYSLKDHRERKRKAING